MTDIRTILSQADERLRDALPELAFVGRNRNSGAAGAPDLPQPWALLDVVGVDYTQQGRGGQQAEVQLTVEVAAAGDAYGLFGLLDRIHAVLHGLTAGDHAPLCRTALRRGAADSYVMTYRTSFAVAGDRLSTVPVCRAELHVESV